jgi:hypothetical protein
LFTSWRNSHLDMLCWACAWLNCVPISCFEAADELNVVHIEDFCVPHVSDCWQAVASSIWPESSGRALDINVWSQRSKEQSQPTAKQIRDFILQVQGCILWVWVAVSYVAIVYNKFVIA